MLATNRVPQVEQPPHGGSIASLLRGFRFRVCANREDTQRALAVRRRVYLEEKGLNVEVPDEYDRRSWILIAEDEETRAAIGTMRLTPRSAGDLEAERSFRLPGALRAPDVMEVSRFAILPEYRRGRRAGGPGVSIGLFKLVVRFALDLAATTRLVVCSKPERIQTYTWLRFQRTGVVAPYVPFGGEPHEILFLDLRYGFEPHRSHELVSYFDDDTPEVIIPSVAPELGCGLDGDDYAVSRAAV